ncbi:MAG TPA: hypothetical protein VFP84_20160 [Kofleriaceae bacterium]|nr:hypothetical protein [Kofleriaceae bacterium]
MLLPRIALPLALVASACGAQIADGGDPASGRAPADAGGGITTGGTDAPVATPIDAPPTATTCTARTLYLNFTGQQLTRGTPSDATQNIASWLQSPTGTAAPYHANDPGRDVEIQSITDGVKQILARFPVTVVTTRPAAGPYVMAVLGGEANDVRSRFSDAVNTLDCNDAVANDVMWVGDRVAPLQHVVNDVIGGVGFGLGLTATTAPNDCMCGWGNDCDANNNAPCTLGQAIARDPAATPLCAGAGATQNEVTAFHDAFCGKSAPP